MVKFEEYKYFAESTQYLSERRQSVNQTYLMINVLIYALLAYLFSSVGFQGWFIVFISMPFFLVGSLICLIWSKILSQYKSLIGWRHAQLMTMEKQITGSYQMYSREWEDFFKPRAGKEKFGFSLIEAWFPRMFMILYVVIALVLLIPVLIPLY